jgi:hypothetical protein
VTFALFFERSGNGSRWGSSGPKGLIELSTRRPFSVDAEPAHGAAGQDLARHLQGALDAGHVAALAVHVLEAMPSVEEWVPSSDV